MFKKKRPVFLLTIVVLSIGIGVFLAYFLFCTSCGSSWLFRHVLSRCALATAFTIGKIEGNLSRQLTLAEIEISKARWLLPGYHLKIQKLDVYFTTPSLAGLNIEVHNGRFFLPGSGVVFFDGIYQEHTMDFNMFSKNLDISEILALFPQQQMLRDLSGNFDDFDCLVKGAVSRPSLKGKFTIKTISYRGSSLNNSIGTFSLEPRLGSDPFELHGEVVFGKGIVCFKRIDMALEPSKILFLGDPKIPRLDINAETDIEDTKIKIFIKGDAAHFSLKLSSEPQMPKEKLMVMLLTGKSWSGTEKALKEGQVSADMAKEFLDYFIFGGSASELSQQLGISYISLKLDSQTRGVEITKKISENLALRYGVNQSKGVPGNNNSTTTQMIKVVPKFTQNFSVEGAEVMPSEKCLADQSQGLPNKGTLFLKYNKKF